MRVPVVWAQERPVADVEARVGLLLERMTLDEKLGQLEQLGGNPDGQPLAGQRDLVRKGLLGSLFNVRGARNTNAIQHIAIDESPIKIPVLFAFDVLHGYRTHLPDAPWPGE